MTDVVGRGIARETVGASDGVLNVRGLVREAVVLQSSPAIQVILSGLVRETVVVPATIVLPSAAQQYAVSVIS